MSEVTLARCEMCGQIYHPSEHHKCLLKPTQSNIINAINKGIEDAKKPQLIKPLWFETWEKEIRADERAKAERDFQNSDYWNDYLAKVIADARADEREEAAVDFVKVLEDFFAHSYRRINLNDIYKIADQVKGKTK